MKEWISGLQLVNNRPTLRYAFMAIGIAFIGDSILGVLLVAYVQNILGVGASEFGWILAARGLGGLIGGISIARLGASIRPKILISSGLAVTGILLLLLVLAQNFYILLAGMVVIGLPIMAWLISGQTWLQQKTPDEYRGRIFGAFETTVAILGLIGMAFATFFGEKIGIMPSLSIAAILFVISGGMFFLWLKGVED